MLGIKPCPPPPFRRSPWPVHWQQSRICPLSFHTLPWPRTPALPSLRSACGRPWVSSPAGLGIAKAFWLVFSPQSTGHSVTLILKTKLPSPQSPSHVAVRLILCQAKINYQVPSLKAGLRLCICGAHVCVRVVCVGGVVWSVCYMLYVWCAGTCVLYVCSVCMCCVLYVECVVLCAISSMFCVYGVWACVLCVVCDMFM